MKERIFKSRGFLNDIYTMVYNGKNLPTESFTYIGRLIIAFVISTMLLPITIMRLVIRKIFKTSGTIEGMWGFVWMVIATVVPAVIGHAMLTEVLQMEEYTGISIFFESLIITFIASWITAMTFSTLSVVLIVYTYYIAFEVAAPRIKHMWKANVRYNKTTPALELYKSLKVKYCKKIKWV